MSEKNMSDENEYLTIWDNVLKYSIDVPKIKNFTEMLLQEYYLLSKRLLHKEMCSICLKYMYSSDRVVYVLKCNHKFHKNCYEEYIKNNIKCKKCSNIGLEFYENKSPSPAPN